MITVKHLGAVGAFVVALAMGACRAKDADQAATTDSAPSASSPGGASGMGGMAGMSGMGAMQMGSQMMAQMDRMAGDSMMQMMPQHMQMVGDMMAQMDREMQGMGMKPDATWTALADSVRGDMTRMRQMSAAEMQSFMAGHRGRMMRLMEMHGSMMGDTAR